MLEEAIDGQRRLARRRSDGVGARGEPMRCSAFGIDQHERSAQEGLLQLEPRTEFGDQQRSKGMRAAELGVLLEEAHGTAWLSHDPGQGFGQVRAGCPDQDGAGRRARVHALTL